MRIQPWTEPALMQREQVFEALVSKALKQTMKKVTAQLREDVLVAAPAPQPRAQPATPVVDYVALENAVMATWSGYVESELFPFLTNTFLTSASAVVDGVAEASGEVVDTLTNAYAAEFLAYAQNRMVGIGETLWQNIRTELEAGFAAGEGIKEIAARLTQVAGLSTPRALTVARTEIISAANAGSYLQMIDAGFDEKVTKVWLATEDERTRLSHRHADNQDVRLTDEFTLDIYSGDVKTGTEGLEFPGDPTGTPGNIINCRCSLAFDFEDEDEDDVFTAAKFVEVQHPRDNEGKFKKKNAGDIFLENLDKLQKIAAENPDISLEQGLKKAMGGGQSKKVESAPDLWKPGDPTPGADASSASKVKFIVHEKLDGLSGQQKASFLKAVSQDDWDALTAGEQIKISDAVDVITHPEAKDAAKKKLSQLIEGEAATPNVKEAVEKLVKEGLPSTQRPLGGVDAKTGKALTPGKPTKLRVQLLYNTKFEDGAIMAVRKDSGERIIWDEGSKKIKRQKLVDGKYQTTEALTRGNAYAKWKDEDGWSIPDAATLPQATPAGTTKPSAPAAPAVGKPVALKVQLIYQTPFNDGDTVAVKPSTGEKITWDAGKKRMVVHAADGTTTEYTRGALYKAYKDDTGWFTPGAAGDEPDDVVDTDIPAPAPAPAPYVAPKALGGEGTDIVINALNDTSVPNGTVLFESTAFGVTTKITKLDDGVAEVEHSPYSGSSGKSKFFAEDANTEHILKAINKAKSNALDKEKAKVQVGQEVEPDEIVVPEPSQAVLPAQSTSPFQTVTKIGTGAEWQDALDSMKAALNDDKVPNGTLLFQAGAMSITKTNEDVALLKTAMGENHIYTDDLSPDGFINNVLAIGSPAPVATPLPSTAQTVTDEDISGLQDDFDSSFIGDVLFENSMISIEKANEDQVSLNMKDDLGNFKSYDINELNAEKVNDFIELNAPAPVAPVVQDATPNVAVTDKPLTPSVTPAVPLKMSYSLLVNPKTTKYADGQMLAFHPESEADAGDELLVWNGKTKKYDVYTRTTSPAGDWQKIFSYTKQGAYKNLKDDTGWTTVPAGVQNPAGSAVPVIDGGAPAPSISVTPTTTGSKPKFSTVELNAASDAKISTIAEADVKKVFDEFKTGTSTIYLTSSGDAIFDAVLRAQKKHNQANPDNTLNMLETIKLVDQHSAKIAGVPNKSLFQQKLLDWLGTPEGKKNAPQILHEFRLSPEEKAKIAADKKAVEKAKLDAQLKDFHAITAGLSKPSTTSTVFNPQTTTSAQAAQDKMLADKPWTTAQRAALKKYTGSYYHTMNGMLRGTVTPTPQIIKDVQEAQKGMRPLEEDMLLYRGTGSIEGILPSNFADYAALIGKTFVEPGFSSTSVNNPFGGKIKLEIEAPKGTPAAFLKSISNFSSENELLLAAGTKFEMISAVQQGYQIVVRVRVVP